MIRSSSADDRRKPDIVPAFVPTRAAAGRSDRTRWQHDGKRMIAAMLRVIGSFIHAVGTVHWVLPPFYLRTTSSRAQAANAAWETARGGCGDLPESRRYR
jgi:hypothetical protein